MKKALCLAVILLIAGLVMFVSGSLKADKQREDVSVAVTTLYGDPEAAAGITLRMVSQWKNQLIWDTEYVLGSGETVSGFTFSPQGESWPQVRNDHITIECITHWGMAAGVGTVAGGSAFEPEDYYDYHLSQVIRAVMGRTEPGERRVETVRLRDYYEYYPLEFHLQKFLEDGYTLEVYYDESEGYFTDFLQIPVGEDTVQITLEKDLSGMVLDLECIGQSVPSFENFSAFAQDGCYHAFCLEYWVDEVFEGTNEKNGIYYYPYTEDSMHRRLTLDTGQARLAYSLEPGARIVDMALDDSQNRLYLVTEEGSEYYLNVFGADQGSLALRQKLSLRIVSGESGGENNPYWAQLSVQEDGVLMVWRDGSFLFAACRGEDMELWDLEQYPSFLYSDAISLGGRSDVEEISQTESNTFPWENAWSFDGQRLALASFVDWGSVSVDLAVYTEGGLAWYGVCENSGDIGRLQGNSNLLISPPGSKRTSTNPFASLDGLYRRRSAIAVEEILGVTFD